MKNEPINLMEALEQVYVQEASDNRVAPQKAVRAWNGLIGALRSMSDDQRRMFVSVMASPEVQQRVDSIMAGIKRISSMQNESVELDEGIVDGVLKGLKGLAKIVGDKLKFLAKYLVGAPMAFAGMAVAGAVIVMAGLAGTASAVGATAIFFNATVEALTTIGVYGVLATLIAALLQVGTKYTREFNKGVDVYNELLSKSGFDKILDHLEDLSNPIEDYLERVIQEREETKEI